MRQNIEPKLSRDPHWLFVTACLGDKIVRKASFYLHSLDDIDLNDSKLEFFLKDNGQNVSNQQLGIDQNVVKVLRSKGECTKAYKGTLLWFLYKLQPLQHADMLKKKID